MTTVATKNKNETYDPQEVLLQYNEEEIHKDHASEPNIMDVRIWRKDQMLVTDTEIYQIDLLTDFDIYPEDFTFDEGTAYISGDYFYLYRGPARRKNLDALKPGIYKNPKGGDKKYFIIPPRTEKEKKEYDIDKKIITQVPIDIIDTANRREELLVAIAESNKIFQPVLLETDDMLKRILKLVLQEKETDLDQYKDRFTNKNELFNFKQVVKGGSRVSILVFDRGIHALNLKYTIIVEEKDPKHPVGKALTKPIVISSEDTYEV